MKKIISYTTVLSLLLAAGMGTDAIESKYKNNLLNVELGQTPDNKVSVLLVFEKPYKDPIKVSYKSENEYQILLPETYHSVTSVSAMNALNVRSANVKLVPYFNENKSNGYTKIVINTTRPVVFNAHASSLSSEKVAKNDLVKKLEKETTKKASAAPSKTKSAAKPAPNQEKTVKKDTTKIAKAEPKKEIKKTATTVPITKKEVKQTSQKTENKLALAQQAKPKAETKSETKAKTQPAKTEAKKEVKPIQKQEEKQTAQPQKQEAKPALQQPKQETKTEPKQEQTIKEIKQETAEQPNTQTEVDATTETATAESNKQNEQIAENTETEPIVTTKKQTSKVKKHTKNENSALLALIVSSFMLMILLLKAFGKKTQKYTEKYNKFVKEHKEKEQPEIPDSMKNMNWQEKYRQMKAEEEEKLAFEAQKQEQEKQHEISSNLDNIFENSAAVSSPISEPVIEPQTPAIDNVEETIIPVPAPETAQEAAAEPEPETVTVPETTVEPELQPDENLTAFNELENNVEYMEEPEIIYNEPQPEPEREEDIIFNDNTQIEEENVIDINNLTDASFAISEEPTIENDVEILDLDNEPDDIFEQTEEITSEEPVFESAPISFEPATESNKASIIPDEPVIEPEPSIFVPEEPIQEQETISFADEKFADPEPVDFGSQEAVQRTESIDTIFEKSVTAQNDFSFSAPEPIIQPKIEFSEPESEQVIPELNFESNSADAKEIFSQSFDEPYVYVPESELKPTAEQEQITVPQEEIHKEPEINEPVMNEPEITEPVFDEHVKEEKVEETAKETYATNPLEPALINQAKISKTKGFYLIRYENETALVGYIKDEIFLIHSFKDSSPKFVQTRLTEKKRGADIYLVRSSDFKALIQVSKDNMKTLIDL